MDDIPESVLSAAWRHLRLEPAPGPRVIFPGVPNAGAGPDFREALVLTTSGEVVCGDIEIDRRPAFWRQHHHQGNPRYRRVVFQVVPAPAAAKRAGDGEIPVLAISPRLPAVPPPPARCPGAARVGAAALARLIGWAGECRFRDKADRFRAALARTSPGQTLYEGLMESLGYSHNKVPFRRLAALLPLRQVNVLAARHPSGSLEALLLGSAGLLPAQARTLWPIPPADRAAIDAAERDWASWKRKALLPRADWCFFPVRPANSPPRRLAAAAHLLEHGWRPDPVVYLQPLLEKPPALLSSLAAPARGYWRDHLDFGVPAAESASLLGANRRRDMVINIILPFFYAWGTLQGWRSLRSRVRDIYTTYEAGANNAPLQFMRGRLEGIKLETGAREQQGLLHIYHHYCRDGRCRRCPLLRATAIGTGDQVTSNK